MLPQIGDPFPGSLLPMGDPFPGEIRPVVNSDPMMHTYFPSTPNNTVQDLRIAELRERVERLEAIIESLLNQENAKMHEAAARHDSIGVV